MHNNWRVASSRGCSPLALLFPADAHTCITSRDVITQGNASADGAPFGHWFIGDVARWSGGKLEAAGLRQSSALEIKWGNHSAGEERRAWAPGGNSITMSALIRGRFLLRFRDPARPDEISEVRFLREGDYAIWDGAVEHTWLVEEDSVILTVRWPQP